MLCTEITGNVSSFWNKEC